jgi:acyl-CoA thioesterase I
MTRVAGASLLLLAIASGAAAAEEACPGAAAAFDDNGATWSLPKPGARGVLDILAIGSSSTEGIGASGPSQTYPARLKDELERAGGIAVDVRNAGVSGEVAAKTLPRLVAALRSGWPRLVIWQVGTNDAITGVNESAFRATVEAGIAAAEAAGVPILLMDPQYTTRSANDARYRKFVEIIDQIGDARRVPVFSRFAMMMQSGAKNTLALLSGDGLHMNDRGYRCVAHALAVAIESATGEKL